MHYNFTAKLFTNYFSLILYHKSFSWYLVRLHFSLPHFHLNIILNKKNILFHEYFICVHTFLFPHSQLTLQSKTTFKTCTIKLFMFQFFRKDVTKSWASGLHHHQASFTCIWVIIHFIYYIKYLYTDTSKHNSFNMINDIEDITISFIQRFINIFIWN